MIIALVSETHLKYGTIATAVSISANILLIKVLGFIKRATHVAKYCYFGVIMVITGRLLVQSLARGLSLNIMFHLCFHVVLI